MRDMIIEYMGKKPKIAAGAFLAPNATIIGDVEIADKASVWFGARVRGDLGKITIGAGSNVQDNAVIHADAGKQAVIEENVTIGHGAVLHGCTIKRGAVIGIRAVVLDEAVVGEQAMVAAGSVVPSGMQVPSRHLAAGIPARIKKELAGESLWWVEQSPGDYAKLTRNYLAQGLGRVDSQEIIKGGSQ
jgi:carbonic anhydrase/acetyltransferase-like protein (isoleucine patch superfamily)